MNDLATDLVIEFSPILAPAWLWGLVLMAGLGLGLGWRRRAPGIRWRALALPALLTLVLDPVLLRRQSQSVPDVAAVIVDASPSQQIGNRAQQAQQAADALAQRLAQIPDLQVRTIRTDSQDGLNQTNLLTAARRALADVPAARRAGVILITDGQVHDAQTITTEPVDFPVHALLTGRPHEQDRRLRIVQAPAYGLVERSLTVTVRVEDSGLPVASAVALHVRQDDGTGRIVPVTVGRDTPIELTLPHSGINAVQFQVDPGPNELTLANNQAVAVINGVRDRLRVLLVSGEPHAGERTWRNLLKADPAVDLVHFTILRPSDKADGTPVNELSLIAFPTRELFEQKLSQFDLIVFDRYRRQNVLPLNYLANVATYVQQGGSLLEISGPPYASPYSLYRTPLGVVLPGEPTGQVVDAGFRPTVTQAAALHPVTAGLEQAWKQQNDGRDWGRWLRQVAIRPVRGVPLLTGAQDMPLLVVDRVGKGRVAQLASDQIWLWSRGYEGGGPQAELLRRLTHWLLKEPSLEEERLEASVQDRQITIRRYSAQPGPPPPLRVTDPSGEQRQLTLSTDTPGLAHADLTADQLGLWRIEDDQHTALAVVGALNPPELADVRATTERLTPVAQQTGGGLFWLSRDLGQAVAIPAIHRPAPGRSMAGNDWLGLRANGDRTITGITRIALVPPLLALLLAVGLVLVAWRRESR